MASSAPLPPFFHGGFSGRIGAAREDITPPVGIYARMWGAAKHDVAEGIHRPLTATALSLQAREGDPPCLLAALDLGWWRTEEDEWFIRGGLVKGLSLDPARVIVNLAHTHAGPSTCREDVDKPGGHLIAGYLEKVRESLLKAGRRAVEAAVPATLEWTTGRCDLARNRDLKDPDRDRMVCGFNPSAPSDDTVLVGRASNADGKAIATIVNYACHPVTLAWENTLISPDYVGGMRETVEANTGGAPCLYLHAPSGEVSPREQYSGDPGLADRNGRQLGFAVLSALEGMLPPRMRLEYGGSVESGAPLGTWKRVERQVPSRLAAVRSEVELELKSLPSAAELEESLKKEKDRVMAERLRRKGRVRKLVGDGSSTRVPIWVWRVGDAFIVGQPNEGYTLLQTELRRRFPGHPVAAMNLVNGTIGYLPPKDLYHLDLYQVWQTPFAQGSLERMIEACAGAIEKLRAG